MKQMVAPVLSLLSHRLLPPAVCALFLMLYVVVAFFTDDALIMLVQLVGHNPLALGLLALVAINALIRLALDIRNWQLSKKWDVEPPAADSGGRGHDTVTVTGWLDVGETARILAAEGYRVTVREGFVSARRGVSLLIPRLLWRLTVFLLFIGVAVSLSSRSSQRIPVIEGEPLQAPGAPPRTVERITLEETPGHWFLQRRLTITLLSPDGARDVCGIYPPGRLGTGFLYPRYLALAPLLRITEPGIGMSDGFRLIMLYPPGREDEVALAGDYRLKLVIPVRDAATDPFVSGRFDLHVKLLKGDQLLSEGDIPYGGRFEADGFSVALLDARRYVVTDFVNDYGVLCIWTACVMLCAAMILYLPLRWIWPLRQIQFAADGEGGVCARSRSEGRTRRHEGLFHDLLDRISRDSSPSVRCRLDA